jgi:hypothetical protein
LISYENNLSMTAESSSRRQTILREVLLAGAIFLGWLSCGLAAIAFDFPPERVQATPTPLKTPTDPMVVGPSSLLKQDRIQKELALTPQEITQVNALATQFDNEIARLKQERAKHPTDDSEASSRFQQDAQAATKRFRSGVMAALTAEQLDVLKRILLRENGSLGW